VVSAHGVNSNCDHWISSADYGRLKATPVLERLSLCNNHSGDKPGAAASFHGNLGTCRAMAWSKNH
jgi:hypothetical protein